MKVWLGHTNDKLIVCISGIYTLCTHDAYIVFIKVYTYKRGYMCITMTQSFLVSRVIAKQSTSMEIKATQSTAKQITANYIKAKQQAA